MFLYVDVLHLESWRHSDVNYKCLNSRVTWPPIQPVYWNCMLLFVFWVTWALGSRGELIIYPWTVICQSSSTLSNLNISKIQLASLDQILCIASLGWGERLHKVFGQIGSKRRRPWQQKAPIDLKWGKQCLHLFSVVFDPILFIYTCS